MNITIYGFWRSIASFRVRVALRLKGLPFEEIPIDILSGEQFEPGYAAVNAERVVPTFIHDGHSDDDCRCSSADDAPRPQSSR